MLDVFHRYTVLVESAINLSLDFRDCYADRIPDMAAGDDGPLLTGQALSYVRQRASVTVGVGDRVGRTAFIQRALEQGVSAYVVMPSLLEARHPEHRLQIPAGKKRNFQIVAAPSIFGPDRVPVRASVSGAPSLVVFDQFANIAPMYHHPDPYLPFRNVPFDPKHTTFLFLE